MKFKLIVVVSVCLWLVSCAANTVITNPKQVHLDNSEQQAEIYDAYFIPAKLGNPISQYNMGYLYYNGIGMKFNYGKALFWCLRAAEQGIIAAQNELGYMYYNGLGTPAIHSKSLYWYTQAALSGDPSAQYNLAVTYDLGKGVSSNYKIALYWYQQSARHGNQYARRALADRYFYGVMGVTRDYTKSYYWFNSLGKQVNSDDMFKLSIQYFFGLGVKTNRAKAYALCKQSASLGNQVAIYELKKINFSTRIQGNYSVLEKEFLASANKLRQPTVMDSLMLIDSNTPSSTK